MNIKKAFTEKLRESRIPPKLAAAHGIEPVEHPTSIDSTYYDLPAIVIPYQDGFERVRYLGPLPEDVPKYHQRSGSGVHIFKPQHDPLPEGEPLHVYVTEGELKALSAQHHLGGVWLGLGGVDMFTVDRKLHPDIIELVERAATVTVCFDYDPIGSPGYTRTRRAAVKLLAQFQKHAPDCAPYLFSLECLPGSAELEDGQKMGIDDWLAMHEKVTSKQLTEIFVNALERFACPLGKLPDPLAKLFTRVAFDRQTGKLFDMELGKHRRAEEADLAYANQLVPTEGGDVKALALWKKSAARIELDGVTYDPKQPPGITGRHFNLYTEPFHPTNHRLSPKKFLDLVDGVTQGERLAREYLLDWLAATVQWRQRLSSCVVLSGPTGTGKSTVIESMAHVLMDAELAINASRVLGRRIHPGLGRLDNSRLRSRFGIASITQCQLVAYEEALFRDGMHALDLVEQVKTLITERTQVVERKGVDAVVMPVHFNLIMTTNHPNLLRLFDMGDDRRFLAVWSTYKPSKSWFTEYYEWLWTGDGPRAIYRWLMERDISNFDPREIPRTSLHEELADAGSSLFEAWFNESFGRDGELVARFRLPGLLGSPDPVLFWRVIDLQRVYKTITDKEASAQQITAVLKKRGWVHKVAPRATHPPFPGESSDRHDIFSLSGPHKGRRQAWFVEEWAKSFLPDRED